jgi:hypothetical protein
MTIFTAGKIFRKVLVRAVGVGESVNTALQRILYLGMGENDFPGRFLNMTTAHAVYRLSIVMRNFIDISVTARATDPGMRPAVEKGFIHVKQPVFPLFVHAAQTAKAVAHEAVL